MNSVLSRRLALGLCLGGAAVVAEPALATLTFNFDNDSMSGWHNRVWDPAAEGGGAWVDLAPGRYRMPESINGRKIYPADTTTDNTLFCSTTGAFPYNYRGRGSYLTPVARGWAKSDDPSISEGGLDSGSNTKWARSPKFRITESGDLVFGISWGMNDALAEPAGESDIPPAAVAQNGWTGVALRDVATGAFVLTQRGLQDVDRFVACRFTAQQMVAAGVTSDRRYTLELITTRAGSGSWIALDDVSVPGVLDDEEVNTLYWDFSCDGFQGWHNRAWDAAADGGLGRWVDLAPGVTTLPVEINGGKLWPTEDTGNSLFICTASPNVWPGDVTGFGSHLTPAALDSGSNTRWVRSPEFFITELRDLSFDVIYGPAAAGQLGRYESLVPPVASPVSEGAFAGVALRDAETGKFIATATGSGEAVEPQRRAFATNVLASVDRSHAYTLDLILTRGGSGSWMALDNVSVPGRLTTAFMTAFSVNGQALRPTGDMVWVAPRGTDVTSLAPTFTLGDGAVCDVESGTARDFTTPQTYTVTLPTGESHAFRLTVQRTARIRVPVTEGLVFHVSADQGVATREGRVTRWTDLCGGTDLYPYLSTELPLCVTNATPNGRPSVRFENSPAFGTVVGQGLTGCGVRGFPCGSSNRTVFVFERYNYSTPPEEHGWGGFTYGFSTSSVLDPTCADTASVFGLVATLNDTGRPDWTLAEQTLGIEGWGEGMDFRMDDAKPGNDWFCHSATYCNDGTLKSFMNGEQKLNQANVSYNTGRALVTVGMEIDFTPFQKMDVCEVLVYDRVLSDAERLRVEEYLRRHWCTQDGLKLIVR